MSDTSRQGDWTKPAAMAIPKGGFFEDKVAILFARDAAERSRCQVEHANLLARCEGVEVLSTLDLEATPPFDYAHDHFGYRDRLSQPVMEGTGEVPTPGSVRIRGYVALVLNL